MVILLKELELIVIFSIRKLIYYTKAAIQIQRVGRGMLGRKIAAAKRWEKKRHDAACLIQLRWRGYEGRKLGKIIKQKHREYEAACLLQRAWRGYKGRAIAKVTRHSPPIRRIGTLPYPTCSSRGHSSAPPADRLRDRL